MLRGQAAAECAFEFQQLALGLEAAAVSAQRAIRRDYSVARDHNGDGIPMVGHANGSKSPGTTDGAGDIGVASGLPIRNREQGLPTGKLKIRSAKVERKSELPSLAREILLEFANIRTQCGFGLFETKFPTFGSQIARIWADRLLAGQAAIKFEGHQPSTGNS